MGDFIEDYLEYTAQRPSPEIFRKWAAITTLSGALEKRVWTRTIAGPQYANLYTMLVAPPGIGKSVAINPAENLLKLTKGKFFLAPNNVSGASFIDALSRATKNILLPDNKLLTYHSLFIFAAELGVFLKEYDLSFLSVINELFDHKPSFREEKRHLKEPIDICRPMTTLLVGSQPGFLAAILPETAWTMGFTSRLLMIYSSSCPDTPLFGDVTSNDAVEKKLVDKLLAASEYYGEMKWTAKAIADIERWRKDKWAPVPEHPKLANYNPRRGPIFTIKLAMVSALSEREELAIRESDVERARSWLLEAEQGMPEIFRDMVATNDDQVIEETFQFAFSIHMRTRRPVPGATILRFLSQRTPAEKAERIRDLMEKSGILDRVAGSDAYIPRAREEHGM